MANQSSPARRRARVGDLATTPRALRRGRLDLIGLFGPRENLSALLRTPSGKIARVTAGDRLAVGQVIAIDETGVILHKNGRTWRLTLPSG